LKNKITQDYFGDFDCTTIVVNIDFCITLPNQNLLSETESLLWAEVKEVKKLYEDIRNAVISWVRHCEA
jgi:hypothetical protein